MDSVDTNIVNATGANKRRVNKRNRDWPKRLHLRKTAAQPPTMQSEDKRGPKKIAEGWKKSTVWPSSKKPPQEARHSQHRTNDSGNTLRFTCSQCGDNLEYVPKDLVRHFEEKHKGSPPVFSCHMCTFSAQEFSYLQVHLLSHKDTFSSCSVCNDNVQRTWPEFSTHLAMYHCHNGKYSCEMCQTFSTGDVRVFLEHIYVHNVGLEGANDDLLLHTSNKNKFGSETTTETFCCQHCGYEASHKWMIAKHIKAVHVCHNGNQMRRKTKEEVHSIAMKPNDPIPKMKPRLTRSAVREMCWLTQDCLSLPGREFLDKYCHLSDPQTTLEETHQFLMKSVAGETGDQKWTKALKTVLSNVPQDMNLNPKSENGIMSDSSDLTVLTVKNKITVPQNGATYAKRLKMMTSSDKDTVSPEGTADDALCAVDQKDFQSHLNDSTPCPQTENKLNNDVLSAQNEPSECAQMQENRENQKIKADQETEEHGKKHGEPVHMDGINISSELKSTNESEEQAVVHKVVPGNKRSKRRRRRKGRSRNVDKTSAGLALKIVLKKNPVKEKQWVSQSSLSPSAGGPTGHGLPAEQTSQILQNALVTDVQQKPGEELNPSCATKSLQSENEDENAAVVHKGLLVTHQEVRGDAEKSVQLLLAEADRSSSAGRSVQSDVGAAAGTEVEVYPEKLQTLCSGSGCHVSDDTKSSAADGVAPCSSYTRSSPVFQPVITPLGKLNSEDLSLALSSNQSEWGVEGMRDRDVPVDSSCPDLLSKATEQEPPPDTGPLWQPVPKTLERTLKLVAINPSQLVRRPAGDQPVVVLNHPDADIPEVARIMEVINRYKGEVQKVVLSQRTVRALSAMSGEVAQPIGDALPDLAGHGENTVQERFMLKLKLRRLSRKKYEVVGAVSPGRGSATKFRCWFCGRVFVSQETWMVHRQRHLMEWKRPNCELLNVAHTG